MSNMPKPPVNPLLEQKMMRQVMRRMANRSPSVARAGGDMDLHFARAEGPSIGKSMMAGGCARRGGGRRVEESFPLSQPKSQRPSRQSS